MCITRAFFICIFYVCLIFYWTCIGFYIIYFKNLVSLLSVARFFYNWYKRFSSHLGGIVATRANGPPHTLLNDFFYVAKTIMNWVLKWVYKVRNELFWHFQGAFDRQIIFHPPINVGDIFQRFSRQTLSPPVGK